MEHDAIIQEHVVVLATVTEKVNAMEKDVEGLYGEVKEIKVSLSRLGWGVAATLGGVVVTLALEVMK